jgi:hypothetical protein
MERVSEDQKGSWMTPDSDTDRLAKAIEGKGFYTERCGDVIAINFPKGVSAAAFDAMFNTIASLHGRVVWTVAHAPTRDQVLVWLAG